MKIWMCAHQRNAACPLTNNNNKIKWVVHGKNSTYYNRRQCLNENEERLCDKAELCVACTIFLLPSRLNGMMVRITNLIHLCLGAISGFHRKSLTLFIKIVYVCVYFILVFILVINISHSRTICQESILPWNWHQPKYVRYQCQKSTGREWKPHLDKQWPRAHVHRCSQSTGICLRLL